MASVTFDHVSKHFAGDVKAIDDLSLQIEDGEFMVLVGPSGCGKTPLALEGGALTIELGAWEIATVQLARAFH